MSRYIWRGTDWASPSIQPYIELGLGNFSLGAWGAYITNPQSKKVYLVFGISF